MTRRKEGRGRRANARAAEIHPSKEPYRSQLIETLRRRKGDGGREITQGEITDILRRTFGFSGVRERGAGAVTRHLVRTGVLVRLQTFARSAKNRYQIVLPEENAGTVAPGTPVAANAVRALGKKSVEHLAREVAELERRHAALAERLAGTLPAVRAVEAEMERVAEEMRMHERRLEELGKERAALTRHPDWPEFDDLDRKLKEVRITLGLF